jgi:hypothetical protein
LTPTNCSQSRRTTGFGGAGGGGGGDGGGGTRGGSGRGSSARVGCGRRGSGRGGSGRVGSGRGAARGGGAERGASTGGVSTRGFSRGWTTASSFRSAWTIVDKRSSARACSSTVSSSMRIRPCRRAASTSPMTSGRNGTARRNRIPGITPLSTSALWPVACSPVACTQDENACPLRHRLTRVGPLLTIRPAGAYLRSGTLSSPRCATMSWPDEAGRTCLSISAILPDGSM